MSRYHVEIIGVNEEKGEVYGYVEGKEVRIDPFVTGLFDWEERDNILGKYVLEGYWYDIEEVFLPTEIIEKK